MGIFFGTDGLRGKVNDDLSCQIAYKCGNALGSKYQGSKILIGKDTRKSGDLILLATSLGLINAGCDVVSVGLCPTAGVAYLAMTLGFDYGIVISASHNPAEFNGIKIFDKTGKKLSESKEQEIEKRFLKETTLPFEKLGSFQENFGLVKKYKDFLISSAKENLNGMKIVLDMSNGASSFIAPMVFKKLGAKIWTLGDEPNGENINKNCGSLHIQNLQKEVLKRKADLGFAYDGDSDRIIAVDEKGNVVDGDKILYLFASVYKQENKLIPAIVVGTRHTNIGIEKKLKSLGIELKRTDIGDRFVSSKLTELGLLLGGEQSGHILVKDKLPTGDGILNSILIASICKKQNKNLSEFFDFELTSQANLNVLVRDKMKVINSEKLSKAIDEKEKQLGENGRVMIRVSGTEPYVRIMVECEDAEKSIKLAKMLAEVVQEIDREFE